MIKNKYDDINKIKEEIMKEMKERGYDDDTINEWLSFVE